MISHFEFFGGNNIAVPKPSNWTARVIDAILDQAKAASSTSGITAKDQKMTVGLRFESVSNLPL